MNDADVQALYGEGSGVPLFDRLQNAPVILGNPTVVAGVGVTHLRYPVARALGVSRDERVVVAYLGGQL